MLKRYFKNKFNIGKETPPINELFQSPLRIGLNTTINVNLVDVLMVKDQLHESFILPSSTLTVMSIGIIKGDESAIYRIYANDDNDEAFVLQLTCSNNHHSGKEELGEIILFKQIGVFVPDTEEGWDELLENIGHTTFEVDEVKYERIWGDTYGSSETQAKLISFDETLIEPRDTTEYNNQYLLYSRTFKNQFGDNDVEEFILAGIEESADSAEFTIQVGINLTQNDVRVQ